MDPDWNDLKVLLAVAREGSIAGAARTLAVDHSTVSRRLGALEEVIGAKLLMRGGRDFSWTAEGRAVLVAAKTVESAILEATRNVRAARLEAEGAVRVSVPPGFVIPLMPVLAKARIRHPQLDVQLLGDFRQVDLGKGEADIAVRMARPEEPDLVGRKTFECGWCVFASNAYLNEQGWPATADELRFCVREPFVSRTSSADLVTGRLGSGELLEITSQMPQAGVIFSDGVEGDFLRFDIGVTAKIGLSARRVRLVEL